MRAPYQKHTTAFIAILLVCSFVFAPVSSTLQIQKVHAIDTVEVGPMAADAAKTAFESTVSAVADKAMSGFMESLTIKELQLDVIAWALVNIMLEEMIKSTTQWVNSGFQGSPTFVTDFNGWLTDLADKVAGDIIWRGGLGFLCSPFKLNVQLALDLQYSESRERFVSQCTLSSVVDNMENFFAGDFYAGGWDGWFEMTLNRQNNPYGAVLEGQTKILAGIQGAQGEAINIYQAGRGFLGKEVCEVVSIDANGNAKENCFTVTPGSVIETQLNETLNIPRNRLTIADEINELIGALLSQLVKQVTEGDGGLIGLTEARHGGSGDYFTRTTNTQTPTNFGGTGTGFTAAIQSEWAYYSYQKAMADLITQTANYKDATYGAAATCHSGDLTASLSGQLTNTTAAAAASLATYNTVVALNNDYTTLQGQGIAPATIQTILTRYGATTIAQAQGIIMNRLLTLRTNGSLHTEIDLVPIKLTTYPALQTEVQNFKTTVDTACRLNRNGAGVFNPLMPR